VRGFESLDAVCDWIGRQQASTLLIYAEARRAELVPRLPLTSILPPRDSEFQATTVPAARHCRGATAAGA